MLYLLNDCPFNLTDEAHQKFLCRDDFQADAALSNLKDISSKMLVFRDNYYRCRNHKATLFNVYNEPTLHYICIFSYSHVADVIAKQR